MAIFGNLQLEEVVQVNDKTRIDATTSFVSADEAAITLLEIEPEAAAGYIDVTNEQYLDWQYATDGDKTISLRITTDGAPETITATLSVLSAADDYLFSSDEELLPYEPHILRWVRDGRNSFLDVHRAAQDRIVKWLDEHKIWDINGNRLTKAAIVDIEEVNDWSKFMVLKFIFEGISNATDDIFHEKALRYQKMMLTAQERAALRLDRNNDGEVDTYKINLKSLFLKRR